LGAAPILLQGVRLLVVLLQGILHLQGIPLHLLGIPLCWGILLLGILLWVCRLGEV